MLARVIVRLIFGALGLWLAAKFVPGISISDTTTLILAAILLGVINAVVRPIVVILTLPFTIITLGLFLLIVNAAVIGLASIFFRGFHVHDLWAGVLAAVVTGIVSWIGSMLLRED